MRAEKMFIGADNGSQKAEAEDLSRIILIVKHFQVTSPVSDPRSTGPLEHNFKNLSTARSKNLARPDDFRSNLLSFLQNQRKWYFTCLTTSRKKIDNQMPAAQNPNRNRTFMAE
jgi:hypothetical protein